MNKIIISTVIACGLLLLDSPEAAAHQENYTQQRSHSDKRSNTHYRDRHGRRTENRDYYSNRYRDSYRRDYNWTKLTRAKKMPRWLKHDRSFKHWYEHSRLRRDRLLSWIQLFDIYRWEYASILYRRY